MKKMPLTLEQYLQSCRQELVQLLFTLCAIPAPSNHEEKRAEFCLKWLKENGVEGAYIDPALNVIWPYRASEKDLLVMTAHTDTVFPDEQPFTVTVDANSVAHCPAIGDDTGNAAELMLLMRYVAKYQPKLSCGGIIFALNSGEEGLGNLKGIRRIFSDFDGRIACHLSLDGSYLGVTAHAVGSRRYRITLETEGGHSYSAFGHRNAIEKAAKLIESLYQVQVPEREGTRTTYNVGTISGGTSVNTIAQKVEFLYEYRSTDRECLEIMEQHFRRAISQIEPECTALHAELLGERPCDGDIDVQAHQKLICLVQDAAESVIGKRPGQHSASTDCNIPLSLGIPAVNFGGLVGRGAHTYEESLDLNTLKPGMRIVSLVLSQFFA